MRLVNPRLGLVIALIVSAAAARLALAGVPNVSPLAALALFSGASLADRKLALLIPVAALFLGDLVLGLHNTMLFVYGAFALTVLVGVGLSRRMRPGWIFGASLLSSSLFFAITNFGVWAVGDFYPPTVDGLVACYIAAVPFFYYTIAGDLFFTALIFGVYAIASRRFAAATQTQ